MTADRPPARIDPVVAPPADPAEPAAAEVVDARGLRCPLPVIRLAARAAQAAPGDVVGVRWSDPAARHDVPAWARLRGHEVVATRAEGDAWLTLVRLGPTGRAHPDDDDGGHPAG